MVRGAAGWPQPNFGVSQSSTILHQRMRAPARRSHSHILRSPASASLQRTCGGALSRPPPVEIDRLLAKRGNVRATTPAGSGFAVLMSRLGSTPPPITRAAFSMPCERVDGVRSVPWLRAAWRPPRDFREDTGKLAASPGVLARECSCTVPGVTRGRSPSPADLHGIGSGGSIQECGA